MLTSPSYRRLHRGLERAHRIGPWESRGERISQRLRDLVSSVEALPAIPVGATADDEIHMLCGSSHVPMGRISLWSLLRWLPYEVAVYVHDDGTLTEEDKAAWRRSFPNLNIVSRADAETSRAAFFGDDRHPYLREFSRRHLYAPKIIDFHLVGPGRRVIMLDSDVLFFRRPDELIEVHRSVMETGRRIFTHYKDPADHYIAPRKRIASVIGRITPRFNAGMCLVPKFGEEEFRKAEEILGKLAAAFPDALTHLWVEQTLYAAMAALYEPRRMSSDYTVGILEPNGVSTHYAGHFRELFFTEGLELLG